MSRRVNHLASQAQKMSCQRWTGGLPVDGKLEGLAAGGPLPSPGLLSQQQLPSATLLLALRADQATLPGLTASMGRFRGCSSSCCPEGETGPTQA